MLEQDQGIEYVAGLDRKPPTRDLQRTEFLEADIRNPLIAKLIPATGVDTVVHAGLRMAPKGGAPWAALHDTNVLGSLQLLSACEKTDSIRTLIVKGSAAVYGYEAVAPSFHPEAEARHQILRTPYQRDIREIESFFETFARRHPGLTCTMLRFQPSVGMSVDSPVTRYLSLPVVPTPLGFDPRLQLIHEDDAVAALIQAVKRPVRGPVNIAAQGTISLTRMLRLAGKLTLPVLPPFLGRAIAAARIIGVHELGGDFAGVLRYGRGVDLGRMIDQLGFKPKYTTEEAVRDYIQKSSSKRLVSSVKEATIGAG